MAAGDGKVALVRSITPLAGACPSGGDLVDLVGYGDANCSEGGLAAPVLGANVSGVRAQNGCVDTNVNGADFGTASPPVPRNSASPLNDCTPPTVVWPHDVQSALDESPLVGQIVAVRGIVTAKRFNNGFFIQAIQQQNRLRRLMEYRGYENRRRVRIWVKEHLAIIEALKVSKCGRASQLMHEHLEKAFNATMIRSKSERDKN